MEGGVRFTSEGAVVVNKIHSGCDNHGHCRITCGNFLMITLLLLVLLNSHRSLTLSSLSAVPDEDGIEDMVTSTLLEGRPPDYIAVADVVVNHFRLWSGFAAVDEDLGFWVKPRSTTWFSRFLLEEYDEQRWVQLFRFTKQSVFGFSRILTPHIGRQDTNYRAAVPVVVCLACVLFKITHGASLLICSEMFAVGKSTVSIILREVIHALNDILRDEMLWPGRDALTTVVADFQSLCGLSAVAGAIDGTHFGIRKPKTCSADYYYFKTGGYAMSCQAVVDSQKRFLDIYVGMLGSTNDARMLRRSILFSKGQAGTLWHGDLSFNGFAPFLLGDAGYPLLPWIMVPHRRVGNLSLAESLFNRRLSKGRAVVENTFAMLKTTFRELQGKSELSLFFLPDVVNACALLHNVLIQQSHDDVDRLLQVLEAEALARENRPRPRRAHVDVPAADMPAFHDSEEKRQHLGLFLSQQRIAPDML